MIQILDIKKLKLTKPDIKNSKICGCYNCVELLHPSILDIDDTGIFCPYCNLETIVADSKTFNLTIDILLELNGDENE